MKSKSQYMKSDWKSETITQIFFPSFIPIHKELCNLNIGLDNSHKLHGQ